MQNATDAGLDRAFDDGEILRTHIIRPTWHFVCPQDIRWLQELTAARVHVALRSMSRNLGLDSSVVRRSSGMLACALQNGNYLARSELQAVLHQAGIDAENRQWLSYLVMYAELEDVICSGPRRGKQFT